MANLLADPESLLADPTPLLADPDQREKRLRAGEQVSQILARGRTRSKEDLDVERLNTLPEEQVLKLAEPKPKLPKREPTISARPEIEPENPKKIGEITARMGYRFDPKTLREVPTPLTKDEIKRPKWFKTAEHLILDPLGAFSFATRTPGGVHPEPKPIEEMNHSERLSMAFSFGIPGGTPIAAAMTREQFGSAMNRLYKKLFDESYSKYGIKLGATATGFLPESELKLMSAVPQSILDRVDVIDTLADHVSRIEGFGQKVTDKLMGLWIKGKSAAAIEGSEVYARSWKTVWHELGHEAWTSVPTTERLAIHDAYDSILARGTRKELEKATGFTKLDTPQELFSQAWQGLVRGEPWFKNFPPEVQEAVKRSYARELAVSKSLEAMAVYEEKFKGLYGKQPETAAAKSIQQKGREALQKIIYDDPSITPPPAAPLADKTFFQKVWGVLQGKPGEWSSMKELLGDYLYARTVTSYKATQKAKELVELLPDKLKREAIVNWMEAGGEAEVLKARAVASKSPHKAGYEAASKLTPEERAIAQKYIKYFDDKLQEAIDKDLLDAGIDNYVMHIWEKEGAKRARALGAEMNAGMLRTDPSFIRKRILATYFEGEQKGLKPVNKDIAFLVTAYDRAFEEALAARGMVKGLSEMAAKDGRPLTALGGAGRVIGEGKDAAVIVKPSVKWNKDLDIGDYVRINHPALRGWKWLTSVGDTPVLMQGDLLVHPEIANHMRALFKRSGLRDSSLATGILKTGAEMKHTMLSFSGFHQVQEGLHGIFHKVNPMNVPEIPWDSPVLKELVKHGLMLHDYNAFAQFSEGAVGGGIINKIPGVGPMFQRYSNYLFTDYIPRLKTRMALDALERNIERFGKKMDRHAILEMTSNQANAAFGELNYKWMGRSQTFQDVARMLLLAPDFLEARMKFVGQALTRFGTEQRSALIRGALGLWGGARIINAIMNDGDTKPDKPFTVVIGGKEIGLRSVPGDVYHLIKDPQSFAFYRISPTVRYSLEALIGRDEYGRRVGIEDMIKDTVIGTVPIPIQAPFKKRDMHLWEGALQSFGVSVYGAKSKAELESDKMIAQEMSGKKLTSADKDRLNLRRRVLEEWREKKTISPEHKKELREMLKSGKMDKREFQDLARSTNLTKLQENFKHLNLMQAAEVWHYADTKEKMSLIPLLAQKYNNAKARDRVDFPREIMIEVRQLLGTARQSGPKK